MEQTQAVLYALQDEIATITLNRPKALNSMNDALVRELHDALDQAEADKSVRVIVLTGAGRAFCAGGDLAYLRELKSPIDARSFIVAVGKLAEKIMRLSKPVIAMVNGVAAGAGFNLALACDIIYSAKSARFAQSFAKVGLVPDCAGMYLLPRVVGKHKAKELMFTADLIGAEEASRLGLVNALADDDKLLEETYAFAEKLKQSAPLALTLIKSTVNRADTLTLDSLLEQEAHMQTVCMQTNDHKEGVAAFLEKRPPAFTGK